MPTAVRSPFTTTIGTAKPSNSSQSRCAHRLGRGALHNILRQLATLHITQVLTQNFMQPCTEYLHVKDCRESHSQNIGRKPGDTHKFNCFLAHTGDFASAFNRVLHQQLLLPSALTTWVTDNTNHYCDTPTVPWRRRCLRSAQRCRQPGSACGRSAPSPAQRCHQPGSACGQCSRSAQRCRRPAAAYDRWCRQRARCWCPCLRRRPWRWRHPAGGACPTCRPQARCWCQCLRHRPWQ